MHYILINLNTLEENPIWRLFLNITITQISNMKLIVDSQYIILIHLNHFVQSEVLLLSMFPMYGAILYFWMITNFHH